MEFLGSTSSSLQFEFQIEGSSFFVANVLVGFFWCTSANPYRSDGNVIARSGTFGRRRASLKYRLNGCGEHSLIGGVKQLLPTRRSALTAPLQLNTK